jgi:hypothetical protein
LKHGLSIGEHLEARVATASQVTELHAIPLVGRPG